MSSPPSRRSGRRPGQPQTREAIAAAARAQFAELGYERTTMRGIAVAAGVDPALVVHYFKTKDALFLEVMAMPPEIAAALSAIAEGPVEEIGRRLATLIVGGLENPASRAIVLGRIRAAATHDDGAALVRETVAVDIGRLVDAIGADRGETRAALVGTQLVGLAFTRYVVELGPLAAMSPGELIEVLAPTLQRYLTGPLEGVG
jgi:AcrR family transcriptional regulator